MPRLMTKEDVKTIQFYQMPKVFFGDTKYAAMKNESKIAYMLLQDLLPLSIKNNWVNDKGEVFVKLSRKNLMSLLNIKGTQKIAQVMKELVELDLIIYKQIGLSKCNEIYICLPNIEEPVDKNGPLTLVESGKCEMEPSVNVKTDCTEIPKTNINPCETQTHINTNPIKTNYTKTNITPSINQERETEGEMDLKELYDHFANQVHIEDLNQRYDEDVVEEVINNICQMYIRKTTRIQGQDMPNPIIRNMISKLGLLHVEHVIDQFLSASRQCEIRRVKPYLQTLIYNSIFEASSRIRGRVRYEMGY